MVKKLSRPYIRQIKNPMKYEMIPIIIGMNLSVLFEISLSLPIFLAHMKIIAKGRSEVKTNETISKTINSSRLNIPFSNDNARQIIINNGIQIIGGLVIKEMNLASFILFINLFMLIRINKIIV